MKTKKIMSAALALTLALTVAFATPITADAASVGKVKGFKVEQSNNRVVVKWKKVKRAAKYQVYRATKLKGKYKRIATTKKRTYNDKKAKGLNYYKVRAVRKNGKKGKFSAVKRIYKASGKIVMHANGLGSKVVKISIKNPSPRNSMYFMPGPACSKLFVIDRATGKIVKNYTASLSDAYGRTNVYTSIVPKRQTKNIHITAIGGDFQYFDNNRYEYAATVMFTTSKTSKSVYIMSLFSGRYADAEVFRLQ